MEFSKATPASNQNRLLLLIEDSVMGRISETCNLKVNEFGWRRQVKAVSSKGRKISYLKLNHLTVKIKRSKSLSGETFQTLSLIPHMTDWKVCVVHAFATNMIMNATNTSNDGSIFPGIKTSGAKKINEILLRIYEEYETIKANPDMADPVTRFVLEFVMSDEVLTKGLTSHSARRGSAQTAALDSRITADMIAARGNWAISAFNKLYVYLTGNQTTDLYVSRILAGWSDPFSGGIGPDLSCIPEESKQMFVIFAKNMFSALMHDEQNNKMRCGLACILMLCTFVKIINDEVFSV